MTRSILRSIHKLFHTPTSLLLYFLLATGAGCTTPLGVLQQERHETPIALREIKEDIADLKHSLQNVGVELQLLEEQVQKQSSPKTQAASISSEHLAKIGKLEKQIEKLTQYCTQTDAKMEALETSFNQQKKMLQEVTQLKTSLNTLTAALQTKPITYKVKPGDSLEKIAKLHKVSVAMLKETNNLIQNTIRIGQELVIPERSEG